MSSSRFARLVSLQKLKRRRQTPLSDVLRVARKAPRSYSTLRKTGLSAGGLSGLNVFGVIDRTLQPAAGKPHSNTISRPGFGVAPDDFPIRDSTRNRIPARKN